MDLPNARGRVRPPVESSTPTDRLAGLDLGRVDAGLRSLFVSNILPIFFWTFEAGFVEANDAFLRLIEFDREEFYREGVHFSTLASPEDEPTSRRVKQELTSFGRTAPFEKTYRLRSGREMPILIGVSLLPDRDDMGVGYAIDLTERKQVERELGRTEQRFRIALERSPVVLFTQDDRLRYTWVHNPAMEDLGASFLGKTDRELFPEWGEGVSEVEQLKGWVLANGRGRRSEIKFEYAGASRIYDMTVEPIVGAGGAIVGISGAGIETTDRHNAEVALRASEARERARADELHALMELVPASVWIAHDKDARRITGSRASYEMLRLPYGTNASITAPVDERPANFRVMRDGVELGPEELPVQMAARGVEVRDSEHDVVFDDGTVYHLCGNATPLYDEAGRPRGAVSAFVDVTRLKQVEEMLREADRRKGEFLAILSHELRNPLASISSAVDVLDLSASGDPDLAWARDVLRRQVGNLTRIIDDLLDITRLNRGKIQLRLEPVHLAPILRRAIETARPHIERRRHTLAADLPEHGPLLRADPTRLEQVFVNLLSNAAKYTPEGGRIEVALAAEGPADGPNEAVVTIRDNGEGIAPELIDEVFELFTQADHSLDRSQGGLGIGLALVRRLVEKHGGVVRVASDGPGRGSTFTVRLPTIPAAARGPDAPPAAAARAGPPGGARVLVVEDNPDTARGMVRLLRLAGHSADAVHDGEAALRAAGAATFDVVLLDIGLPGINGLDVARALRARPDGHRPLLLALSGYGQAEDRARSLAAGFDDHLVKPVQFDAILRAIATHRA